MARSCSALRPITVPALAAASVCVVAVPACTASSRAEVYRGTDVLGPGAVLGVLALALAGVVVALGASWMRGRVALRSRGVDGHELRDPSVTPGTGDCVADLDVDLRALAALVDPDAARASRPLGDGPGGRSAARDRPVSDRGPSAGGEPDRDGGPVLDWPFAPATGNPSRRRRLGVEAESGEAGGVDGDARPESSGGSPPAPADGPPRGVDGRVPPTPVMDAPAGAGLGAPSSPMGATGGGTPAGMHVGRRLFPRPATPDASRPAMAPRDANIGPEGSAGGDERHDRAGTGRFAVAAGALSWSRGTDDGGTPIGR